MEPEKWQNSTEEKSHSLPNTNCERLNVSPFRLRLTNRGNKILPIFLAC